MSNYHDHSPECPCGGKNKRCRYTPRRPSYAESCGVVTTELSHEKLCERCAADKYMQQSSSSTETK